MTKVLHKLLVIGLFGLVFGMPFTAVGQEGFREKLYEANQLMEEKLYNKAIVILQQLHAENPDNYNVAYKLGDAYLHSGRDKELALEPLRVAAKGITEGDYMMFDLGEENAPIEAQFLLGQAYHLNYEMDSAIAAYRKFLEEAPKKHYLRPEAERQIVIAETAKMNVANPIKDIEIVNIGGVVNGEYPDFSPVISVDENALFFTSRRLRTDTSNANYREEDDGQHYEDIYVSYRDLDGNWGEPELLNFSNPSNHEATINVSPDGQLLFVYIDTEGDGNIYTSTLVGDTWTEPEKLPSDINTKSWETHATMTADGQTMYFVSDRKGGMGGRDIYRVVRLPNGEWSKALNIGGPLNTEYDEDAPYLHPNGRTMYFASKGHNTMGGFDIFKTELQEDGSWGPPQNIGYPINTVDDDVFFVTSGDGKRGYFSSVRNDGYGEKDIYVIYFPGDDACLAIVKGRILPEGEKKLPDNITIYASNLETGQNTQYRPRQRDGGFAMILEPCNTYTLDIVINDESLYTEEISIPCDACYFEYESTLNLNTIAVDGDSVYVLTPIKPDTAKPVLNTLANEIHWELRYADTHRPVQEDARVAYMTKEGNIRFVEEVGSAGEFKYHEIPGISEYHFAVQIEDNGLCPDFEVVLIGADGKGLAEAQNQGDCVFIYKVDDVNIGPGGDITAVPCAYKRYFKYNKKDIAERERRWKEYVDCVAKMIEVTGSADVYIEGSASFVPTETWKTNENLARKRSETARDELIAALKARKVDASKVNFVELKSVVQGPPYSLESMRPVAEYEENQYVQMYAVKRGERPAGWVSGSGTFPQEGNNNSNTNTNNNTNCAVKVAPYQRFYTYNKEGVDQEARWNQFVDEVANRIKTCGNTNISIEGSASEVRTETWKSNTRLSKQRAEAAKEKLLRDLRDRKVDVSKVNFTKVRGVVQGPSYTPNTNMHVEKMKEYEKYQYVKIEVN